MKVGTTIDQRLFRRLKVHAAAQGTSISTVIEESLEAYLSLNDSSADERMAAFERVTADPFGLSDEQLQQVLEEDSLDL